MKPGAVSFAGLFGILLSSVLADAAGPNSINDPYAGWPKTWVDAYHRFENYNLARLQYFPTANLEISPDGTIFHTVQLFPSYKEHVSLVTFRDGYGGNSAGLKTEQPLFARNRAAWFPPGTYAGVLISAGMNGYQFLYPMVWFEVLWEKLPGASLAKPRVRMLPPPPEPEKVWPNERLLQFLDFHNFPKTNPNEFYKANSKVAPNVTLRLTNSGAILREEFPPEMEKLLRWRIYHNGKLIESGSAAGITRFDADRGSGNYQAFVGVEGPDGFMPVSNFLQFPLFPEKSGQCAVFPSATNADRFPDFFLDVFSRDQLDEFLSRPHSGPDDLTYYNKRSISLFNTGSLDDQDEALLRLWTNWSWSINRAIEVKDDSLTSLADVLEKPSKRPTAGH